MPVYFRKFFPSALCTRVCIRLRFIAWLISLASLLWLMTIPCISITLVPSLQQDKQRPSNQAVTNIQTPTTQEVKQLSLGVPVEKEITGGSVDSYQLDLKAGQYALIEVEQRGIDLTVVVLGSNGARVAAAENGDFTDGLEQCAMVADKSESYRLEIQAQGRNAARGSYVVKLAELREAKVQDKDRTTAQNVFTDGVFLHRKGDAKSLEQAMVKFQQALELWQLVKDREKEASAFVGIGRIHILRVEAKEAINYFNQALTLYQAISNHRGEATSLHSIGRAYDIIGEPQKAIDYYNQALTLRRTFGDLRAEADTLGNMGIVYDKLGDPQKALDYYNQALPLRRAVGNRHAEAYTLNNIGIVYFGLGDPQKALDHHNQALPLIRVAGDRRGEAITLNNIGTIYDGLGERQKAFGYHNQALPLYRIVGDRRGEAITLINIGIFYYELREPQKALDYYNQALPLYRSVADRHGEANSLSYIGTVYDDLGKPQKALDYYNEALPLFRSVSSPAGETRTLSQIGSAYYSLGNLQKSLEYFSHALEISRTIKLKPEEAGILRNMAIAHRDIGDFNKAYSEITVSLDLIENIRSGVISKDLRASYLDSIYDYYELAIDIAMRLHKLQLNKGFDSAAFQISERARARTLLELLTESRTDFRQAANVQLIERERLLQQQLGTKAEQQSRLLSSKHTEAQAALAKEIEKLLIEIDQVRGQIRQHSPQYAALTQPKPVEISELQKLLDSNTVLLEYALGEKSSYLWAITSTSITSYQLPPRKEIEKATQHFYQLLTARNKTDLSIQKRIKHIRDAELQYSSAARELSKILLGPVSSLNEKERLVVVADGSLQYIPFTALTWSNETASTQVKTRRQADNNKHEPRPLILTHEIINLPSASTLAALRQSLETRTTAAKKLAVIADPVFTADDLRVRSSSKGKMEEATPPTGTSQKISVDDSLSNSALNRSIKESRLMGDANLSRLKYTRDLADAITSLLPQHQALKLLDFDASRDIALSSQLGDYQTIVFASHGLLNSTHPELSGIVLSLIDKTGKPQNGFLRLSDVYNMKLNADLVVLGACETGLGKQMKGEGLIGLTRGFMYAGAPRVLASLWQVDEDATVELLKRFYIEMEKKGARPAEALRNAQMSLRKEKRWESPYYWAGFILQGEWK